MRYNLFSKLPTGLSELNRRLAFLLLSVVIFRIGVQTPLPGVDLSMVAELFQNNKSNLIVGYFDIFTGGALSHMSLLALSIYPYISASIIIQLLSHSHPSLESLRKDGEKGRQVLNQYTRYLTLLLALVQSFGMAKGVMVMNMALISPAYFYLLSVVSLTTGTMFLMWLGDQITRYGIGNGISILMFSGIVSRMPETIYSFFTQAKQGQVSASATLAACLLVTATILLVVIMERAQRRIPLTYPRRQNHLRRSQSIDTHSMLPLKLNMTGVLPPIVAQMLIVFPIGAVDYLVRSYPDNAVVRGLSTVTLFMHPGTPLYILIFAAVVLVFAFYLTTVFFNSNEIADNLKKSGAMIAGVRPGGKTGEYIDTILSRLTLVGGLYLALVAAIPDILIKFLSVPALFGGTSLLISVVVVMEFVTQVQTYLLPSMQTNNAQKQRVSRLFD